VSQFLSVCRLCFAWMTSSREVLVKVVVVSGQQQIDPPAFANREGSGFAGDELARRWQRSGCVTRCVATSASSPCRSSDTRSIASGSRVITCLRPSFIMTYQNGDQEYISCGSLS
jgi:hypothetical protein